MILFDNQRDPPANMVSLIHAVSIPAEGRLNSMHAASQAGMDIFGSRCGLTPLTNIDHAILKVRIGLTNR